jgi:DNA repair protein SbcC/Rad50
MRILKLQFTNLNSLAGTWCIDFTHPAFTGGGIFAITGPTGAGKSTILDAICLALYGKTPRLKALNAGENEIMSRLTAGCSSEVTFQTQSGTYRCTWAQKLARGKTDGKRQPPTHEIVDVAHGILATQKGTVAAKIVEITGMDFEQFTRSMLLAQGSFAAFLQADASGRAPVLEQITGTGIYSQISIFVFERYTREKNAMRELELELGGMEPLSGEELAAVERETKEQTSAAAVFRNEAEQLRIALGWLDGIGQRAQDVSALELEWKGHEHRNAMADGMREKLRVAQAAASIEQSYISVQTLRLQLANNRREQAEAGEQLPALEQERENAALRLNAGENSLEAAKAHLISESDVWKRVRSLDTRIVEIQRQCDNLYVSRSSLAEGQETLRSEIGEQDAAIEALLVKKAGLQTYFSAYSQDAGLVGAMSMIGNMVDGLRAKAAKRTQLADAAETAGSETTERGSIVHSLQRSFESLQAEVESASLAAAALGVAAVELTQGKTIGELRTELDEVSARIAPLDEALRLLSDMETAETTLAAIDEKTVTFVERLKKGREYVHALAQEQMVKAAEVERSEEEMLRWTAIQSLDEQRSHLTDGEPCPLCGAREHPYVRQTPEEGRGSAARLKELKAEVQRMTERLHAANMEIGKIETELSHYAENREAAAKLLDANAKACGDVCAELKLECTKASLETENGRVQRVKSALQTLISKIEKKSAEESIARKTHEALKEKLHAAEKMLADAQFSLTAAVREVERVKGESRIFDLETEQALRDLRASVSPYGLPPVSVETLDAACTTLRTRLDAWVKKNEEKETVAESIDAAFALKRTKDVLFMNVSDQAAAVGADIVRTESECAALAAERGALYGTKDPNREEAGLLHAIADAERRLALTREDAAASGNRVLALTTHIELLARTNDGLEEQVRTAEAFFTDRLRSAGFGSEADYAGTLITPEEREELQRHMDTLRDEEMSLGSRLAQKRGELQQEQEKMLTEKSAETLRSELTAIDEKLSLSLQAIGSLEQRLRDNDALLSERLAKEHLHQSRKNDYERWNALNELIGSRDGKRFQKIAQAITFERMVALANGVLTKMSPRYYLQCDPDANLEMNIVDLHQAGEVRSTKNLSGGESFIVSLSLALGLSQMASRNVRVDSLFLDEGFGTLDEDALDTALTTLSELQQDGKCIGVISHVGALKERIATQIVVTPETGGRSRLSGPGCSSL